LNPHALMDTWPSTMPVYQFQHLGQNFMLPKEFQKTTELCVGIKCQKSDLAGARTQDPLLKREMLYRLSYQIISDCGCKYKSILQSVKRISHKFEKIIEIYY